MKPVAAALAAALISGTAMYTAGARTAAVEAFTHDRGASRSIDWRPAVAGGPASARPASMSGAPQAPRPAQRASRPAVRESASVSEDAERTGRTWTKSALIIGGSAASGAGVGAIVDGKKGALIGAAIGGGAASIYEATLRK